MTETSLIKPEKKLRNLMRLWMILFAIASLVMIFMPEWIMDYIGKLGWSIFSFPLPNTAGDKFYQVLAVGYLITLTAICFLVQRDVLRKLDMVPIVIIAKLATSIGYIICFVNDRYFIYLVSAIVDGLIFLITLYYYQRAAGGRYI